MSFNINFDEEVCKRNVNLVHCSGESVLSPSKYIMDSVDKTLQFCMDHGKESLRVVQGLPVVLVESVLNLTSSTTVLKHIVMKKR